MKIPFDIKYRPQIESGEYKVETNDHHSVRIICWNKNTGGLERIVALVAGDSGQEKTLHYTEEGLCVTSGGNKNKDLFIITPEPEQNEFEVALEQMMYDWEDQGIEARKIVAQHIKDLRRLAREEIIKSGYAIVESEHYLEEGRKNYERGKEEALKDLPRWKKVGLDTGQTTLVVGYTKDEDKLYRNGYVISLPDLEKLPKED